MATTKTFMKQARTRSHSHAMTIVQYTNYTGHVHGVPVCSVSSVGPGSARPPAMVGEGSEYVPQPNLPVLGVFGVVRSSGARVSSWHFMARYQKLLDAVHAVRLNFRDALIREFRERCNRDPLRGMRP